jgi:hypothetical protein
MSGAGNHVEVVVLAGMHQGLPNLLAGIQRPHYGCGFHEVRPGSNHVKDFHLPDISALAECQGVRIQ